MSRLRGGNHCALRALPAPQRREWCFSFCWRGRGAAEAELRRRGYDVAGAERLLRFSLPSLRQPPGPARRLAGVPAYLRGFRAWLRGLDVELVHANTLLALPELAALPRHHPPVALDTHEMLPDGPKGVMTARLARRADVVVAVSDAVATRFVSRGLEARAVHNGVVLPPGRGPRPTGRLVSSAPLRRSAAGREAICSLPRPD